MSVVIPVNITKVNPAITITLPGINNTFQEFVNSLGAHVYNVELLYMSGPDFNQISQSVGYSRTEADGKGYGRSIPFYIDPYQYQPAKFMETDKSKTIIDNNSNIQFVIIKNSTAQFKFFGDRISVTEPFEALGMDNFSRISVDLPEGFFDDYSNYLY